MQKFIDPDHPFYRPLWRRLLIVVSCALWTAVEFYNGAATWGFIFLAATAYTSATLLVFYKPKTHSAPIAPGVAQDRTVPADPAGEPAMDPIAPATLPPRDETRG